jgi:hypothetical protein
VVIPRVFLKAFLNLSLKIPLKDPPKHPLYSSNRVYFRADTAVSSSLLPGWPHASRNSVFELSAVQTNSA